MQQLGGGYGGHRHRLVIVFPAQAVQVDTSSLGGDEYGGIDQRAHGLRRARGRLC